MYVIYETTHHLPRRFPLAEGLIKTTNQIFPSVVHTLVLNHRIRRIDRVSAKFFAILSGKVRYQCSIIDLTCTRPDFDVILGPSIRDSFAVSFFIVVYNNNFDPSILKCLAKFDWWSLRHLQQAETFAANDGWFHE